MHVCVYYCICIPLRVQDASFYELVQEYASIDASTCI